MQNPLYDNISKMLIPGLFNSYYFILLYENWVYEKAACKKANIQVKVVWVRLYANYIQSFSVSRWF